ncbi:MAG: ABC transporter ATP-binding protein [Treponema sp.]|jgi:energy-coupling factor transport system ATP-binding protein|nr:ABC transporter ATP-binding protein [Treponema sp.]
MTKDSAQLHSPVLVFKDFSFRYRSQAEPSLIGINLSVNRGEKILILGPSGSGKSTLAHCINGLIPNAFPGEMTGSLSIFGEDAAGLGIFGISKKAGTVLQDTDDQFVGQSAGEDIAFAAENDMVPVGEMRRRVKEAAELVQFEEALTKAPQELSGGQKQRVSMAGVLTDDVEILLFDEPLANLDPATGKQAIETIDRLNREQGKTVIIIEHRLEDVLHRPVDRIILIDKGRIIADLLPEDMLASDLLGKTGIREPLYLSALRFTGCGIHAGLKPEHVETVVFDAEKLRAWAAAEEKADGPCRDGTILEIRDLNFCYDTQATSLRPQPEGTHTQAAGAASKRHGTLENISFSIPKSSITALVGKNGAGKSTLAALICGFYKPASGAILYEGKDIAGLSIRERAEKIGFVMQNPNHMISFPLIYDEAALGLRNRELANRKNSGQETKLHAENEIREKVYESFRICGLYPYRNWPVSALSYGMKKRLTIASILSLGPSLLILDEPTAGQDLKHYREIMDFLFRLNRDKGISLLLITHDMHLMLEYADRAVVLSEGRILAIDSPSAVLTDDSIIEKASLKRTSLYDLALRAGITEYQGFINRFISLDREKRYRQ